MPNTQTVSWITLVAALGVGSIVSAMVGWWSAKAVAISNHRQNWINALRDDLVTFLKQVDVLHFLMSQLLREGDKEILPKQQDARNEAMMVYRRILMRLNMTEELHVKLGRQLKEMMAIDSKVADENKVHAVIDASRELLKYEWAVAKYGMFLIFCAPTQWRKSQRISDDE
jgi:hypothetical protein